jgi:hypothetical protein
MPTPRHALARYTNPLFLQLGSSTCLGPSLLLLCYSPAALPHLGNGFMRGTRVTVLLGLHHRMRHVAPPLAATCCHGLAAATRYLDVHFPYRTADSSFSINNLTSSPLPMVIARHFFMLPVPSPSFLLLLSPSGTFRSRSLYAPLLSSSFCTLPPCSS